ncbi:MAG: hypothetical protein HY918_04965 [Candidatus Doudnabacteria bacterium]|nr:hypothetical protein [Candidatus Doudnabacteria bacterium]
MKTAAQSGLIELPFFSSTFYKPPAPERIIIPDKQTSPYPEKIFEKKLSGQIEQLMSELDPANPPKQIPLKINLTENELTALIQNQLKKSPDTIIENAQIAINSGELELFGYLKQLPKDIPIPIPLPVNGTSFNLGIKPIYRDNNLDIKLTKLKIGMLSLPISLGNWLIDAFLRSHIKTLTEQLTSQGINITNLSLTPGEALLEGEVPLKSL